MQIVQFCNRITFVFNFQNIQMKIRFEILNEIYSIIQ